MVWDVTPLEAWKHIAGCEYFSLVLEVLELALYLQNPACIEIALHGLGHLGAGSNQHVHTIINNWAKRFFSVCRELLTYAEDAGIRTNSVIVLSLHIS